MSFAKAWLVPARGVSWLEDFEDPLPVTSFFQQLHQYFEAYYLPQYLALQAPGDIEKLLRLAMVVVWLQGSAPGTF